MCDVLEITGRNDRLVSYFLIIFLYYKIDSSQRLGRSIEFHLTDHAIHDAILRKVLTVGFGGFYCLGQGKNYFDNHKTVDYEILQFIGEKLFSYICSECNNDAVQNHLGAYPN